jgi:hypothetical protein
MNFYFCYLKLKTVKIRLFEIICSNVKLKNDIFDALILLKGLHVTNLFYILFYFKINQIVNVMIENKGEKNLVFEITHKLTK